MKPTRLYRRANGSQNQTGDVYPSTNTQHKLVHALPTLGNAMNLVTYGTRFIIACGFITIFDSEISNKFHLVMFSKISE